MTVARIVTIAIAIVFPVSMLLYSNSRITEVKDTLRAEIAAGFACMSGEIKSLEAKLVVHDLEHHRRRL